MLGRHPERDPSNEDKGNDMSDQYDGARAMSADELRRRAEQQADGMRNTFPDGMDSRRLAEASLNFWQQQGPFIWEPPAPAPQPTMWQRLKRWLLP